ncbi:MAG: hypothetical protein Q9217_004966 [Psora testacea]
MFLKMSRHKLVKSLDLEEELDDFDGGPNDEFEEDLNNEDKELDQKTKTQSKKPKSAQLDPAVTSSTDNMSLACGLCERIDRPSFFARPSTTDFFNDSPWLNVPGDRKARILIEPSYPRGRLLGGSSRQGDVPPKTKLAALAAARRKENQKTKEAQLETSAVALLGKLSIKSHTSDSTRTLDHDSTNPKAFQAERDRNLRKYASQSHGVSNPPSTEPEGLDPPSSAETAEVAESPPATIVPVASPSFFARAMFGPPAPGSGYGTCFTHSSLLALSASEANANHDAFAGPSPDDVVLKAQSSSKGRKQAVGLAVQSKDGDLGKVAQGLKDVNLAAGVSNITSKNLDVVTEYARAKAKNAANFVVIGHVDAGKSTLMGRLLHDLKVVDQRTVNKYRTEAEKIGKASFALAWVLDQGTEERERGVTIDIANHKFETEKTIFTILDAPGHRDFIPNMIAGASQADFAVLVIDASTGNFESGLKGQTKEHALLVRSMGVQRVIVAVNKLDTIEWSRERFDEVSQQLFAFLTAAGFPAKNISFVPCSGLSGGNIVHKASDPLAAWYTGPPLVSLLESSEPITRAIQKPLRLTIDDIFRGGVQNPISVSGRIDAGTVQIGDRILILPVSKTATVKGLDVDKEPAEWAVAGQNVVLHLTDIEAKHLRSGDVICLPSASIQCVKNFTVKLLAFEHIMPMHCEIHRGRLHAPGRISKLEAVLDKASGAAVKGRKPKLVKPGNVARIVVEVEDAIPLENGSRVILRAGGETVGAGLVE